jgi:cytochrome b
MLAVLSAVGFLISFVLYAANAGSKPFDYIGVALISLLLLAAHAAWGWYPWHRPGPPPA